VKRVLSNQGQATRRPQSASASPSRLREEERRARKRALAFHRAFPNRDASLDLCLSDRTLRDWRESWANDKLHPGSRGRPSKRASSDQRLKMIGILWVLGVGTGWDVIKTFFPDLSRREARRLLRRVRKLWKHFEREGELALEWPRPGTVWALDFTDAPNSIDGKYPYILDVRDLASGKQLMSLPCEDETEATATAALRALIAQYGAPIVLKSDNGSAFIAHAFRDLLEAHGTTLLYSPPRLPEYNGSCEAGHGSIKTRAHHHAGRRGHAEAWTCDDVEAARLETNATARPRGVSGPTPDEAWNGRRPIEQDERDRFRAALASQVEAERSRRGFSSESELGKAEQASVQRAAIARALTNCGLLLFKTRRVSPAIPALVAAIFS
jgi:transposase InsO family protein